MKTNALMLKKALIPFLGLALFVSTLTLVSCEKEEISTQEEGLTTSDLDLSDVSFEVVDGRLVFASLADVQHLQQKLEETPAAADYFDQISDFTSAREAYLAVTEEVVQDANGDLSAFADRAVLIEIDGDKYLEPVVDGIMDRHITNENGIVQVGTEIYQYSRDYVIVADADKFLNASSAEALLANREARKIPIVRNILNHTNDRVNVAVCKGDYENKRRVRGELEERNNVFNSNVNCNARTKHFRKGAFGIYFGEKADQLSQFGCLSVNGNSGLCYSVDKTLSNRQEISDTFFTGPNAFISGSNTVRHYAREGSIDGECFTQPPF